MPLIFSYFNNPLFEYLRWLKCKFFYELRYRKQKLFIGYQSRVQNSKFGCYNWLGSKVFITNSRIGDYTYINDGSIINNVTIGKFCSLASGIRIAPGKHPTSKYVSTHPSTYYNPENLQGNLGAQTSFAYSLPVTIENDVWIGANAIIIDGVTIGNGAIVAANSVVTKNVEPYSIVAGIPAMHQRYRFNESQINFLQQFKWWDKNREWLINNIHTFSSIDELINKNSGV